MRHVHLPLLPLPVLAAVVAFSACSGSRTDEAATRVIPPAALAAAAAPPAPVPPVPSVPSGADAPSDEEVLVFERPVPK
jgi:hypothetical protein